MRTEGISFSHALQLLRRDLVTVNPNAGPPVKISTVPKLPPLISQTNDDKKLLEIVVSYYHKALKESPEAQQYLLKRGLKSAEMVEHFRLGFANRTLGYYLPKANRLAGADQRGRLKELGAARERTRALARFAGDSASQSRRRCSADVRAQDRGERQAARGHSRAPVLAGGVPALADLQCWSVFAPFTTAANEEMLLPWCAHPALAADLFSEETRIGTRTSHGKKPHQGVAGKNPALHPGIVWSNSTTALGLPGVGRENRVRSRCTGKERDSESGLDNFGARYDSSSLGRFMTPDPLGGRLAKPQTLNKYNYVANNPINFTDPTGPYMCADDAKDVKEHCTSDKDKAFETERKDALKSDNADVVRGAFVYGDPGKDNGVSVAFGDPGAGNNGITNHDIGTVLSNPNGMRANETVTIRDTLTGTDLKEPSATKAATSPTHRPL